MTKILQAQPIKQKETRVKEEVTCNFNENNIIMSFIYFLFWYQHKLKTKTLFTKYFKQ